MVNELQLLNFNCFSDHTCCWPLRAARLGFGGSAGDNLGCCCCLSLSPLGGVVTLDGCCRMLLPLVRDWHFFKVSSYVGWGLLGLPPDPPPPEFFRTKTDLSMLGFRATDGFNTGAGRLGWAGNSAPGVGAEGLPLAPTAPVFGGEGDLTGWFPML